MTRCPAVRALTVGTVSIRPPPVTLPLTEGTAEAQKG
uniref:Cysteine and serine rich nuclear protein 3 n=1 Tax=Molossus molossus TaxID=27622 RepID=A0A7J8FQA5_MOLMO|nr:cysteine and serine rich nuclear protein 3 [Molossus molossus]